MAFKMKSSPMKRNFGLPFVEPGIPQTQVPSGTEDATTPFAKHKHKKKKKY